MPSLTPCPMQVTVTIEMLDAQENAPRSFSAAGVKRSRTPRGYCIRKTFLHINSTSHFDGAIDVAIGVGFFRHYWYFKEVARERRRLYFPFQPGGPPRIRPSDLAVLQ